MRRVSGVRKGSIGLLEHVVDIVRGCDVDFVFGSAGSGWFEFGEPEVTPLGGVSSFLAVDA